MKTTNQVRLACSHFELAIGSEPVDSPMLQNILTLFILSALCAEMEDEFMDEDIDERAEDIAESISTQVPFLIDMDMHAKDA